LIEIADVSKRFGKRPAVIDLSLTVPAGGVFGLLGHNGAGKSTTLGMLLGQVFPDRGKLAIDGHDVFAARRRALGRTGAIFESPVFYDYLTGWRNLRVLCACSGHVPRAKLIDAVELVGLGERIHDRVATYSHGMRQRLALAQALLPDPQLLILDEPSDGLDPEGIAEMRELIGRLNRERGLTILFSSHLLAEAERLCTHVAVMRQGRLLHSGPWREQTGWVALHVDRPDEAATLLRDQQLIVEAVDGRVRLARERTPADLTTALVQAGFRVEAVTPIEQTLESFYLAAVDADRKREGRP